MSTSTTPPTLPAWRAPRRVDVWWWMELEYYEPGTQNMIRGGCVSWNQDGTGTYRVSMSCEREGYGFVCWPSFRALSDAQTFIETLMMLPFEEIMRRDGTDWRRVL